MRALILVILAAAVLYFAWGQLGGVDAADTGADSSTEVEFPDGVGGGSKGAFLSMSDLGPAPEAQPPMREGPETPAVEPTAGVALTTQPLKQDPFDLNALGDPLYEGSLLLHRPEGLQEYLNTRGKGLSTARKNLLICYMLVSGGSYGQVSAYAEGLETAKDVTPAEWGLLSAALEHRPLEVREASSNSYRNPLILGVTMALMDREAEEAGIAGEWDRSASLLSELLLTEIDAPWKAQNDILLRWSRSLKDAQVSHRWSPDGNWNSTEVVVQPGDTLVAIRKRVLAERPSLTLCTGLIERANQLGRYLREGQKLRIPTDKVRTMIDLSARWLFYMHGTEVVAAWPVGIGRKGQETTPGRYKTGEKTPEPAWFPRGGMVPYGDPENPLGTRWIGLDGSDGLGIHGTWLPETIGTMASDGCVRLRNEDVEELFEIIPRGSEVWVRP